MFFLSNVFNVFLLFFWYFSIVFLSKCERLAGLHKSNLISPMEFSMILNYLFIGHVKIERLGFLSVFNCLHSSALWSLDSVCVEVGGGWTDGEYYLSGSRSITTPYSSKEQNNNAKLPMRYLCSNLFELSTLTIGLSSNRSSFGLWYNAMSKVTTACFCIFTQANTFTQENLCPTFDFTM